MKKYCFLTVLFFAGIMFATAQTQVQDKRVNNIMSQINQACHLTSDQSYKILPMVQNFVNTAKANRQQFAGDKVSLKTANQTNRQNFRAKLGTVLTPAQMDEFKQYMKQKRQQRQGTGDKEDENGQE